MNLQTRLGKLEAAACVNETCIACAAQDVFGRAFCDVLKRYGVDVRKLPKDCDENLCGECGAVRRWNVHGMDEGLRAEWREANALMSRCERERVFPTEAELQKIDELIERDRPRCLALYGEHYAEALEAADAAAVSWMDEHAAEMDAAWQRPPLAVRRGLAA